MSESQANPDDELDPVAWRIVFTFRPTPVTSWLHLVGVVTRLIRDMDMIGIPFGVRVEAVDPDD